VQRRQVVMGLDATVISCWRHVDKPSHMRLQDMLDKCSSWLEDFEVMMVEAQVSRGGTDTQGATTFSRCAAPTVRGLLCRST
jgi:hypothetical protein